MLNEAVQRPYLGVLECLSAALSHPAADPIPLNLGLTSDIVVTWCLDLPSHGRLVADMPSPRALDTATLTHLAAIAMPAVLRYPGIVVPDQRKQRLRFVFNDLEPQVHVVMCALESLLNQCDVVVTLLIDGRSRPQRFA